MNPLIPALIQGLLDAVVNSNGGQPPSPPPTPLSAPAGMLRAIPPAAEKATMNPPRQGMVQMDDKLMRLSPGSQIRDETNRIVLPMNVQHPVLVRYTMDRLGNVHQVWILTKAEAESPVTKSQ